jgi:hypothetical protein
MLFHSAGSAPDPYALPYSTAFAQPYSNRSGKTVSDPRPAPGETVGTFIIAGQSLTGNNLPSVHTATNPTKIHNVDIFNGQCYLATDPLLGCDAVTPNYGNVFTRMADGLVTDGVFDRVNIVNLGIGGTSVGDWLNNEVLWKRLIVASRRLAAIGMTTTAFLWEQGQADATAGTSQANYQSRLTSLTALPRAAGFNAPWVIAQSTYGAGASNSTIRAAQAAIVNNTDILAGPDNDTLTGVNRMVDGTHWTDTGGTNSAAQWKTSVAGHF